MVNTAEKLPRLRVSDNRHFIVTENGDPFFWMGDTAWELFHRLTQEEAELYFANRAEKRFNVIQAVALAEIDGINTPNRSGHRPLIDNDPARPNPDYFVQVDAYIQIAAKYGLYVGLLPTWGDKVTPMWGAGPVVFDPQNAYTYGRFLGERYREQTNIVWIMGGDRPPLHDDRDERPIWRAMASGIRDGVGDHPLVMTYHPMGGHSTSEWIHDEPWLDLNMMQSGHGGGHDVPVWEMIARDYYREPAKPTLDGEPNYEDHPVSPWPTWDPASGCFNDHDVRKQLYRSVFAGGCGVTYGHHAIWQFYDSGREPVTYVNMTWREALDRPAAGQVRYLRALMESRPYLSRVPDQRLLASDPGQGGEHVQATRDILGQNALVYLPESRPVTICMEFLRGPRMRAQWYDPRTGEYHAIGAFPADGKITFSPPREGPDWVLVFDGEVG